MPRKPTYSSDRIRACIKKLLKKGIYPSVDTIRQALGGGSRVRVMALQHILVKQPNTLYRKTSVWRRKIAEVEHNHARKAAKEQIQAALQRTARRYEKALSAERNRRQGFERLAAERLKMVKLLIRQRRTQKRKSVVRRKKK